MPEQPFVSGVLSARAPLDLVQSRCCRCARRPPRPRTASCTRCPLESPQRAAGGTLAEPILACQTLFPAPCSWSCMGLEATHQSCRIRDSRPHPLQPFNDPQPSAPPVNCPHFPNHPGALSSLLFISAYTRSGFSPPGALTLLLLDFCVPVLLFGLSSNLSIHRHSTIPSGQ